MIATDVSDAAIAEEEWNERIFCDVLVAPATVFRKGVKLSTVIDAIRRREGRPIPPLDLHATIARLSAELEAEREKNAEVIELNNRHYSELCAATIELEATSEALDRCLALDPDGERAVMAQLTEAPL